MKKDIIRYCLIGALIAIFGLFVYPTLYKYDKLDQRYPVRINRITGETQILLGSSWTYTGKEASVSEVKKIKSEIEKMISDNHDKLKREVTSEITDSIKEVVIKDLKSEILSLHQEIAAAKAEIEVYKRFEKDPDNYFTIGDTKETVKNIMGIPDTIEKYELLNQEIWRYSGSSVTFQHGKVKEWSNFMNKLRIK